MPTMPDAAVYAGPKQFCASFAGALVSKTKSFTSPMRRIRVEASRNAISVSIVMLSWTLRSWSIPSSAVVSIERVKAGQIAGWLIRHTVLDGPASVYLWDSRDRWVGEQMEALGYPVKFEAREISRRTLL